VQVNRSIKDHELSHHSPGAIEAAERGRELMAAEQEDKSTANGDQQRSKSLTWEEYQALPKHERDRLVVSRGVVMDPSKIPEGVKKLVVNRNGRAYLLIGDQVDEYLAGKKAYFNGKSREAKKKKNKHKTAKLSRKRNR